MIDLNRWRAMGKFFAELPDIKGFIYGASDDDIRAKVDDLRQNQFPVLIGILPSIFGIGDNFDQVGHESPLFFYCMVPASNLSEAEVDEAWDTTLGGVTAIENAIKANVNNPAWLEFYHIQPDTIHIDPEWNMWGLMGWSIKFEITFGDNSQQDDIS